MYDLDGGRRGRRGRRMLVIAGTVWGCGLRAPGAVVCVAVRLLSDFTATTLDEKWCGDITYVQVGNSWLYVASVIDIRSRRVLGWSMATHMRVELIIDALNAAVATRGGNVHGVIFHSDRGSQYTSAAFVQVCDLHGIRRSMGRVGSSYDNALAESLWQSLKRTGAGSDGSGLVSTLTPGPQGRLTVGFRHEVAVLTH
jgi:transposase InsO family protein